MLCETPASWPICFMVSRLGAGGVARGALLDIRIRMLAYVFTWPTCVEGVQFSGMKKLIDVSSYQTG